MNRQVELPLVEPMYSTFHNQGVATAIAVKNPYIRNWYLNEIMNLTCNRKFLKGFTTPKITIQHSSWTENPFIEKRWISTRFTRKYINSIIKEMLNKGYYVFFRNVDDYYLKGKGFYKKRHFNHDGLICGYDQDEKTYCIYAYDVNWTFKKFWLPQKCFTKGILEKDDENLYTNICAIKVKDDMIEFDPLIVYKHIKIYLDSNLEKYPFKEEGTVYGIVVHEYIAEYISMLQSGLIPYEKMDWRILRVIWEHKKVMLERIILTEQKLNIGNEISKKYKSLVVQADTIRMLYASHHIKRRDSILPIIKNKLLLIAKNERELLKKFIENLEKELENESMEIS